MRSEVHKERQVRGCIEDLVLLVMELCAVDFDGPQDLDALTFSRHEDFGRTPDRAPGGVERGVLAEARFVREDERKVLALGFFLGSGLCADAIGLAPPSPHAPELALGVGR